MKTNQELLDFYGVEIGKKYKITQIGENAEYYKNLTFVVKKASYKKGLYLEISDHIIVGIERLDGFGYEEVKPEILDEKEREYLRAVIKPFRDMVESVSKLVGAMTNQEYIKIYLRNADYAFLPFFEPNQMYKGMKVDKQYSLKELGL